MARISRFKLRDSDRSGFRYRERALIKDGPWKVAGEEYDTPAPSKLPLGGEGDVARGEALVANSFGVAQITSTPTAYEHPINYITAAGGITVSTVHPWMYVVGSLSDITLSANPQVTVGVEDQQLTLYGVGSSIRIEHGNGVVLVGSVPMVLGSGDVITLMYSTGDTAWWETSRGRGV